MYFIEQTTLKTTTTSATTRCSSVCQREFAELNGNFVLGVKSVIVNCIVITAELTPLLSRLNDQDFHRRFLMGAENAFMGQKSVSPKGGSKIY